MGIENSRPGIWNAISTTFGDELYSQSGYLLIRSTKLHQIGERTLEVEGTHRWPDHGVIVVNGARHFYNGIDTTHLYDVETNYNPFFDQVVYSDDFTGGIGDWLTNPNAPGEVRDEWMAAPANKAYVLSGGNSPEERYLSREIIGPVSVEYGYAQGEFQDGNAAGLDMDKPELAPLENLRFEYSLDAGANWIVVATHVPDDANWGDLIGWQTEKVDLNFAGEIMIRWVQDSYSVSTGDNWAINDVECVGLLGTADGLSVMVKETDVILLLSSDPSQGDDATPQTDFDKFKFTFFVDTAEGADLDQIARNYGLERPFGLSDLLFRELLKVMIALDASTIYSIEKIMDVLKGKEFYKIWEEEWTHHNEVFVGVISSLTDSYKGKAFMSNRVEIDPADIAGSVVVIPEEMALAYGMWAHDDPNREGINFLEAKFPVSTVAANPDRADSMNPVFVPTDVGKGLRFENRNDYWTIQAVIGGTAIILGKAIQGGGVLVSAYPQRLYTPFPSFESWMVGHRLQITDSVNPNNWGVFNIVGYYNNNVIFLDNVVPFTSDNGGVSFRVMPNFGNVAAVNLFMDRSVLDNPNLTVTCPDPMVGGTLPDPLGVFLDYTTIPSSQLKAAWTQDGNDQYPFYLWDEHATIKGLLDVITAAGVIPSLIELEEL
jgi:hypothetical protein